MTHLNIKYSDRETAKVFFNRRGIEIKWDAARKVWTTDASYDACKEAMKEMTPAYGKVYANAKNWLQSPQADVKTLEFEMYNANGLYYG